MMILSDPGATVTNTASLSDAPAVRLAAANIRFVNTELGRVTSTSFSLAAIEIDAAGGTIVNQSGGVIGNGSSDNVAIRGSAFADTIDNAGTIAGLTALGNGADSYTLRDSDYFTQVDLGADNDRFELVSTDSNRFHSHAIDGGSGNDLLVLRGPIGQIFGLSAGPVFIGYRNFERLDIGAGVNNILGFSDYTAITLQPGARANFLQSSNPGVVLALAGNSVTVGQGSLFAGITGSDDADFAGVGAGIDGRGRITGSVDLGGGNDEFRVSTSGDYAPPIVDGSVDGGTGRDRLEFTAEDLGTHDFARYTGFEFFNGGTWTSGTTNARVTNLNGFLGISGDSGGTLAIADTVARDASVWTIVGGTLILESTVTVARYGFRAEVPTGTTDYSLQQQAILQESVSVFNAGTILGDVQLYYGDDIYDGRLGATGGTIFGYAGNDALFAGVSNARIEGGYGADALWGNLGADTLLGGAGGDVVVGAGGTDSLAGGDGNDLVFGGDGNDSASGDAGIDYIVGGSGNDSLDGGADADALYGEDGDDSLVGGGSFDTDILVGGAGNDTLAGASGLGDYDILNGGAGDDLYRVDTPADLTFEAAGEGTDTIVASITGAGYYLYANTENLVLEGATPFGVGNALDNRLTGNAIGNYLLGGAGNDRLNGKAGNDVLFGEAGADTFIFERGSGGDVVGDFQPGVDRIDVSSLGILSFAQLQAAFVQNGATGAIDLGFGDFIVLQNVTMAQLTSADVLLG